MSATKPRQTRVPGPLAKRIDAVAELHGITWTAAHAYTLMVGLDAVEGKATFVDDLLALVDDAIEKRGKGGEL